MKHPLKFGCYRVVLLLGCFVLAPTVVLAQRTRPAASQPKPSPTPQIEKQEVPQPKRQATINLKTGAPVTGQFIKADAAAIQIEVAGNLLSIKVDDVVSVVFAPELLPKAASEAQAPATNEEANRALRALRKLAGATEIGINFQEYGSRLIDVKNEVDEATSRIPAGDLKNELVAAMEAYVDAGQAWNQMLRYDFMLPNSAMGLALITKYSLQAREMVPGNRSTLALPRNYVLTAVWAAARMHIDRANSLLNSPAVPAQNETQNIVKSDQSSGPPNVVGTWLVTLTVGAQPSQTRLTISPAGDSYTGQFVSAGGVTPVNRIDLTGHTITATCRDVIDRQPVTVDISATIEGDKMTGTARITATNGQSVTVPLAGIRQ